MKRTEEQIFQEACERIVADTGRTLKTMEDVIAHLRTPDKHTAGVLAELRSFDDFRASSRTRGGARVVR